MEQKYILENSHRQFLGLSSREGLIDKSCANVVLATFSTSKKYQYLIFAVMKYRMLTTEEMEIFNEDFKHFAIANGVSNEEWLEMNQSDKEKATKLVGLFSDTVLQKVYEKLKFIEHRSTSSCLVFKLNESDIDLISLNAKSDKVDLSTAESIHEALVKNAGGLTIFRSKKTYSKVREEEIHEMLSQGCVNSSEAFWMLLEKVLA